PGIKRGVLWQGLIDLTRDIPDADVNLLASGNSLLVRKDLHPALQYLLLEAIREVHSAPGPFNRLGEFPAEQPNDLPLSATAQSLPLRPHILATVHVVLADLAGRPHPVLRRPRRRGAHPRHRFCVAPLSLAGPSSYRPAAQGAGRARARA